MVKGTFKDIVFAAMHSRKYPTAQARVQDDHLVYTFCRFMNHRSRYKYTSDWIGTLHFDSALMISALMQNTARKPLTHHSLLKNSNRSSAACIKQVPLLCIYHVQLKLTLQRDYFGRRGSKAGSKLSGRSNAIEVSCHHSMR